MGKEQNETIIKLKMNYGNALALICCCSMLEAHLQINYFRSE